MRIRLTETQLEPTEPCLILDATGTESEGEMNNHPADHEKLEEISKNFQVHLNGTPNRDIWCPNLNLPLSFQSEFLALFDADPVRDFELLRLADYLLSQYPNAFELLDDSDGVPAGRKHLLKVLARTRRGSFSVGELVKQFRQKFWPVSLTPSCPRLDKAASFTGQKVPGSVLRLLRKAAKSQIGHNRKSQRATTPPNRTSTPSPIPEIEKVRNHLNSQPECLFQPIHNSIPNLVQKVERVKDTQFVKTGWLRFAQQIDANPKPQYKAVEGTSRIYPEGCTFLGLRRDLREVVTTEYWKMDLKSAQLYVASSLWGFSFEDLLSDESVWVHLLHKSGNARNNTQMKAQWKTFLYSALFGAKRERLKKAAYAMKVNDALSFELVKRLLAARDMEFQAWMQGKVTPDAWGKPFSSQTSVKKRVDQRIRSGMAAVCQSYELKLLYPVFEYAWEHDLQIVALLHDGLYCSGDWEPHIPAIVRLVEDQGRAILGKPVPLEVTPPEGA